MIAIPEPYFGHVVVGQSCCGVILGRDREGNGSLISVRLGGSVLDLLDGWVFCEFDVGHFWLLELTIAVRAYKLTALLHAWVLGEAAPE